MVVSEATGISLNKWQVDKILNNCSLSKTNIHYDEFYLLMTRPSQDGPLKEEHKQDYISKYNRMSTNRMSTLATETSAMSHKRGLETGN